jgi:predicted enzyme related to lactoylglutathione lyase
MGQPVAFFEIVSPDAERARKFYTEMFGWAAQADPNMDGYALVDTNALDTYLDRAERLGGKRLVPPTDLPEGYGRFAVFTDPDGNQVGLWA